MAFYCWPGGDQNRVKLQFNGQDSVKIDLTGVLKLYKGGQWVRMEEAIAYQVDNDGQIIELGWNAAYINLNGDDVIELGFAAYDRTLPLVLQIGPSPSQTPTPQDGLCWSSFYGGSAADYVFDTATDTDGNACVAGNTLSDFLTFQGNVGSILIAAQQSVLLASFGQADELKWTVYYGGTNDQSAYAIAVKEPANEIYIGGMTTADDLYPWTQAGAYNDPIDGSDISSKGFIAKFDQEGTILWSTYFGDGKEDIRGMDIDTQGRLHIVGSCEDAFPSQTLSGATHWPAGGTAGTSDLMIARFTAADALQWCTAYGGSNSEFGADIACHTLGFYVSGWTVSTDLPLVDGGTNAYDQTTLQGERDNALLSFNTAANCQWASYFGGSAMDMPGENSLATKANGTLYFCGWSASTDMPVIGAGGYVHNMVLPMGAGLFPIPTYNETVGLVYLYRRTRKNRGSMHSIE